MLTGQCCNLKIFCDRNVKCGKLHCVGGRDDVIGGDAVAVFTAYSDTFECRAYVKAQYPVNDKQMGMVPNGTSCARGKVNLVIKCTFEDAGHCISAQNEKQLFFKVQTLGNL